MCTNCYVPINKFTNSARNMSVVFQIYARTLSTITWYQIQRLRIAKFALGICDKLTLWQVRLYLDTDV